MVGSPAAEAALRKYYDARHDDEATLAPLKKRIKELWFSEPRFPYDPLAPTPLSLLPPAVTMAVPGSMEALEATRQAHAATARKGKRKAGA
jgi:hypothetical protein